MSSMQNTPWGIYHRPRRPGRIGRAMSAVEPSTANIEQARREAAAQTVDA